MSCVMHRQQPWAPGCGTSRCELGLGSMSTCSSSYDEILSDAAAIQQERRELEND